MRRTVHIVREDEPGTGWKALYAFTKASYERWFLKEGDKARPSYRVGLNKLRQEMPELVPIYTRLVELAGGGDRAARLLSLYRPTPYLSGCSQVVWTRDEPVLIRNYDYRPDLWEARVWCSSWSGRRTIVMSDCLWGALDGINEDGLVVSLTFGGRKLVGDGFGIPLVLRYLLETCSCTKDAIDALKRVSVNMAYNVSVLDATGDFTTAQLSPGDDPLFRRQAAATNHQETGEWKEYTDATSSLKRRHFLEAQLEREETTSESLAAAFLRPPLYATDYRHAHGTLYTAIYRPLRREVVYVWPGERRRLVVGEEESADFVVHFGIPGGHPPRLDSPMTYV